MLIMRALARWRYVATETAIGIVPNLAITTVPHLLWRATGWRPLAEVIGELEPQFFMCALMSALVPTLLTRWRWGRRAVGPAPSLARIAGTALVLAIAFTAATLAVARVALPLWVGAGTRSGEALVLRAAQAVMAGTVVTPLALVWLWGREWGWVRIAAAASTGVGSRSARRA